MAVIVSVLFLISLFLVIAVYLITIGVHFIGLAYLLVYIGAISILFLFTIMLMNIRSSDLVSYSSNSWPLGLVFAIVIFFTLQNTFMGNLSFGSDWPSHELDIDLSSSIKWDGVLVNSSDISSIGNIMYSSHGIWLIVTGVILFLAMVGTITITLKPNTNKGSASKPLYNKDYSKVPKGIRRFHTIVARAIVISHGITDP